MKVGNSWKTRSYAYNICQEKSILTMFKTCFVASIDLGFFELLDLEFINEWVLSASYVY